VNPPSDGPSTRSTRIGLDRIPRRLDRARGRYAHGLPGHRGGWEIPARLGHHRRPVSTPPRRIQAQRRNGHRAARRRHQDERDPPCSQHFWIASICSEHWSRPTPCIARQDHARYLVEQRRAHYVLTVKRAVSRSCGSNSPSCPARRSRSWTLTRRETHPESHHRPRRDRVLPHAEGAGTPLQTQVFACRPSFGQSVLGDLKFAQVFLWPDDEHVAPGPLGDFGGRPAENTVG